MGDGGPRDRAEAIVDEHVPASGMHGQNGQNPADGEWSGSSGHFGHAREELWDESPAPLGRRVRSLPTDALGGVLGPLATAMAESYQVPSDLVVNLALPLITTAVAGRCKVRVTEDWCETVALATLSALASGERKSPVQRVLARPLNDHERAALAEASSRIAREQAARQLAEDRVEKLRKAALKTGPAANADDLYAKACEDLAKTTVAAPPRWLVDDITSEAIALRLAEHGSIGAVSAEPGLFAILAGRYSGGAPNVETVLKATSGDPIAVDRIGRPPIHVDAPALHISMCIQPGRLAELGVRGSVFRNSGLLARLLYVVPEPRVGTRSITPEPVPRHILDCWTRHLTGLVVAEKLPPVLALSEGALARLNAFRGELEPLLHPHGGSLAGVADFGSKLPGTVVRIAAALTLLGDPRAELIDEDTMDGAVRLGRAYIGHAQAAFAAIHATDDSAAHAREVLGWLEKNAKPVVSLRDIYRALRGRAWIEKADDLRAPLAILVDLGHVRLTVDKRKPGQPGRPSELYALHPSYVTAS